VMLVLGSVSATLTVWAAPPIAETFRDSSAAGWELKGDAKLTGDGITDLVGNGWLRLTDNVNWKAGSAIYNTAFPSTEGVQVTFTYASHGGNGADGITFYLIDGATVEPTVGAAGGALGYSWGSDSGDPGVTNGYVGIGLDECGNFSNLGFGDCDGDVTCPGSRPNSVTLRGSGSLDADFDYLTRGSFSIETGSRAGANRCRITISPGDTLLITVEIDSGSGFVTVIDEYNLTTASGQEALPATFKMGFSGSTGGLNNFHEIRDLVVAGANTTTTAVTSSPDPSGGGSSTCFTATVSPPAATGTVTFLAGTTVIGTGSLVSGVASLCTSALTVGSHTITARYEGNSVYGGSSGTDMHEVNALSSTTSVSSSPDPSKLSETACFTATVSPSVATGIVTFLEGATVLGTSTLASGVATFFTTALTVGSHTITARYEGSPTYGGSTGTDSHGVSLELPEIDVQRPASIADGGSDSIGSHGVGTVKLTYTIDNTAGVDQLNVTGTTASNYVNSTDFTVTSALPIHITAGGTGILRVSFDVTVSGPFTFDMAIANSDWDENPYDISIQGTGVNRCDVDGDGQITEGDVREILSFVSGCELLSVAQQDQADIDGDGDVDIDDARILAEYIIGIRTTLP